MSTKGFIFILLGATLECGWVYGLKHSTNALEWGLTAFCVVASFFLFMLAFRYVGASVAYIVYTGLGTLFVVGAEIAESLMAGGGTEPWRVFFVLTLMAGVVGIKGARS
jgi:paired small multidrug resistance pump